VTSFRQYCGHAPTLVDERSGIGPHHLAIGKTRKLFEHNETIYAFFSRGHEIAYAVLNADSLQMRGTCALEFPVAWGGGAFCVDCDGTGRVALAFLHRNQHELCFASGTIENGSIHWAPWKPLLASSSHQAAPWLELGADGTSWCSVLDRAGDFRLAVVRDGETRVGNLFSAQEEPWYHSCVQVLPVASDRAVVVGFRGAFPAKTELVFKTVSATLELGPSETLAPCNVNDRLTFHFQAVGDSARECAHIVYLDEGLSVSHAQFSAGTWTVSKRVVLCACFAPQICINPRGDLLLLAADYDGHLWRAVRPFGKEWSEAVRLPGISGPNVSPLFAQTGYGTGGLIAAARSESGRVPFLFAEIKDERTASTELRLSSVGSTGRILAPERALTIKEKGSSLDIDIGLSGLREGELARKANSWLVTVPAQGQRALKIRFAAGDPITAAASWLEADGRIVAIITHAAIETTACDAFSSTSHGTIRAIVEIDLAGAHLQFERAWVETYSGDTLIDIAPYQPETTARLALAPELITRTYKRMV
jgi:hypothetical protein